VHAEADVRAGRRARSPFELARIRMGVAAVVAVRLGELVKGAMLTVEKPW
jgi:hypothetical protein